MGRAVRQVLSIPRFGALGVGVSVLVLSLLVMALNLWTVVTALTSGLPLDRRMRILLSLFPFVGTAFGTLEATLIIGAAVTLGLDAAMIAHGPDRHAATDSPGTDAGCPWALRWFGVACVACASMITVGIVPTFGIIRLSLLLPLDGIEFTVPALVASLLSVHQVADCIMPEVGSEPAAVPPGV